MKRSRILLGIGMLVFSIMLSSCFVARKYSRPNVTKEGLYRDFSQTDTANLADLPWDELFTDKNLQQLIRQGLDNNYDLKIAYQQVLAAEAFYKQGKAGYIPILTLDGSVTSSEFAPNSAIGQQFANIGGRQGEGGGLDGRLEQYDLTASLSWEADLWGRIRSNKRANGANFLQSQAAQRLVQTRLVASIASAYFQLLALDAQLNIANETVVVRRKSLKTIQSLKASGSQTEVAVQQTEAQLYTAEILAIELAQQIKLLENTLSILLARSPGEINRGRLTDQEITTDLKVGIPSYLLRNRPDVMQAEYNLVNRFELTNVAKANFYPRLTLSATGGFQGLAFDNWVSSNSLFNNLVAGITQPLLNQRQIRTQLEVAKADQQEALYNFKNTLLIAGQEVSNAMIAYQAESDKLAKREKQVASLKKAETYSIELLMNGYADYLEVLRTSDEKLSAEVELVNSRYQQIEAVVRLYQALGGGWKKPLALQP